MDPDRSGGSDIYRPFRTLTCTAEYPLVTFFTLLTTLDILRLGRGVLPVDAALGR